MTNDYTVEQARQDPIDLVTSTTELLDSDNWESSSGTQAGFASFREGGATPTTTLRSAQVICLPMRKSSRHWRSLGWTSALLQRRRLTAGVCHRWTS